MVHTDTLEAIETLTSYLEHEDRRVRACTLLFNLASGPADKIRISRKIQAHTHCRDTLRNVIEHIKGEP